MSTRGWDGIYCAKHPEVPLGFLLDSGERCFACHAVAEARQELERELEKEYERCRESADKYAVDKEWRRLSNEAEDLMDCKSLPELEDAVEDYLGSDDEWLGRLAIFSASASEAVKPG